MINIRQTEQFSGWLHRLKDRRARARILVRIDRFRNGNPGDVKSVGAGVFEMRIPEGKGYRVYYAQHGESIILLLCGGDKSSQSADIAMAKRLNAQVEQDNGKDQ